MPVPIVGCFPADSSHCCPPPPPHFYHSDRIPCCYPSGYPCSCFPTADIGPHCSSHASNLSSFCFFSLSFSRCPFRLVFFLSFLFRQRSNTNDVDTDKDLQ
jgi:hypothetical protein